VDTVNTSAASDIDSQIRRNRLLATIPDVDIARLRSQMEHCRLEVHTELVHPGSSIQAVYFPTSAVASVISSMEDGSAVEVGMIGNEGLVGIPVFLGVDTMPNSVVVQVAGDSLSMPSEAFREEVRRNTALRDVCGAFTQSFMNQVSQAAACNRLHPIEERAARWLLMTHDRSGSDEFAVTHEYLAIMLGVRRASVTLALGSLQQSGFISYRRGRITILNRAELRECACECYDIMRYGLTQHGDA
jgi:CRP-like cAMP-binding protein